MHYIPLISRTRKHYLSGPFLYQSIWIIILLVLIILGHWSLILQGVLLATIWHPIAGCAFAYSVTTIIYSMCFDFLVMCLSAYQLVSRIVRRLINFQTSAPEMM
ncbi:hypothetical protein BD769DRAFT_383788 [Suillus cothurnatus]|nr:hypothetical protein BD769DRAFT_383788 [Suillus cothurnatus]